MGQISFSAIISSASLKYLNQQRFLCCKPLPFHLNFFLSIIIWKGVSWEIDQLEQQDSSQHFVWCMFMKHILKQGHFNFSKNIRVFLVLEWMLWIEVTLSYTVSSNLLSYVGAQRFIFCEICVPKGNTCDCLQFLSTSGELLHLSELKVCDLKKKINSS